METRTEMLKGAIAECAAAREAVNVKNVRAKLPEDFFFDHDAGKALDTADVWREIQATFMGAPSPMLIKTDPAGHALRPVEPVAVEPFPEYLPPSDKIEPVEPVETIAAPVTDESFASHEASDHGLSAQAKLDAARVIESNLIGRTASLKNAQRAARSAVAESVQAYQRMDSNRETPEMAAARFRATSQATRAARARAPGPVAYVDAARKYATGGDANDFARKMGRTLNRRGAYSRPGGVNLDPTRGATPKPVATPRPAIPMLGK